MGLIPGSGRPLGGGHGNPLQYAGLENLMDKGAWQATVHMVAKNQMTEVTTTTVLIQLEMMCGARITNIISLLLQVWSMDQ